VSGLSSGSAIVQGDYQYRYIWQTGRDHPVSQAVFKTATGNAFDFNSGRQLFLPHFFSAAFGVAGAGTAPSLTVRPTYDGQRA